MKTRRLVKALKRLRIQPGEMLVAAPTIRGTSLVSAATALARRRPELKGTPILIAWPHEIATASRSASRATP